MEFFLQREIELRNFEKIRNVMVSNPSSIETFLTNMVHIHQVVRMEELIPDEVKDEIMSGIENIFADYEQVIANQEQYFCSLDEKIKENFLLDFAKIYNDYLALKQNFQQRYLAGNMPLLRYAKCLVTIGEAERHLKPYMHNLGITNIDFN